VTPKKRLARSLRWKSCKFYVAPTTPSSPPSKRASRFCQGVPITWSQEGVENRNADNVCYRVLVRELRNVEVREKCVQGSRWNEQRGAIRRRKFRFVTVETSSHGENCLTSGHSGICFKKSMCLSATMLPFRQREPRLETPAKPLLFWRLVEP
jgi:hypothetical protein